MIVHEDGCSYFLLSFCIHIQDYALSKPISNFKIFNLSTQWTGVAGFVLSHFLGQSPFYHLDKGLGVPHAW
jgi:hypothetical protein